MTTLHTPGAVESLEKRLHALRPDSPRQWGTMTVDQMLWHINEALEMGLGRKTITPQDKGAMTGLIRWLVVNGPWPKGKAPTNEALKTSERHDFERERARLVELLREFAQKPVDAEWPVHSDLGRMSGRQWTKLQGRHVDYHLSQFGA